VISRFREITVAVLGDFVADEYVYGETERVSREAPVLIVKWEGSELKLGCAGNAAANVRALGARVRAVGVTGAPSEADAGRRLRVLLRDAGIDDEHVVTAPGRPTETKTRILAGGKSTRRQQVLRLDRPAGALGPLVEQKVVRALRAAAQHADAVLVSDYGGGVCTPAVVAAACALARRVPVLVDSRYHIERYRGATAAKPNEPELQTATGLVLDGSLTALERAGRKLQREMRLKALLVTLGRNGAALFRPRAPTVRLPQYGGKEAVDVTGAGDTVMAAFTLGYSASRDFALAARIANVAGGLKVGKFGTATVSNEELAAAWALAGGAAHGSGAEQDHHAS
jgi:rfaE bifunctional protein kinase chain/domain